MQRRAGARAGVVCGVLLQDFSKFWRFQEAGSGRLVAHAVDRKQAPGSRLIEPRGAA